MEQISEEQAEQYTRVCAIDIGKAGLVACVRVPHETNPARRVQEVREYATVTPALLQLADWLRCQQVQLVAMEATSSYWKPVFYLLEAEGFECWLVAEGGSPPLVPWPQSPLRLLRLRVLYRAL